MPNSSGGISGSCVSCAAGWAGSSATSAARSKASQHWRRHSSSRLAGPRRSTRNSSASAAGNFILSMPRRWSASAKAAPYEFGVKASFVTNNRRAPGGLFVLHARALPDNPYDGHTLRDVVDRTETLTGCAIERAYVDKGYRGHDAQNPRRIFISGQKRGVFGV